MATTLAAKKNENQGLEGFLKKLSDIKIGGSSGLKVRQKDMVYIFRNLSTLLGNGLSLNKALATLQQEKSLKKYQSLFLTMEQHVNQGSTLSSALTQFPDSFHELLVHQIKVAERTGALVETITRITEQLENGANIKALIIKKLTYPVMLSIAGAGSMTFMLLYVVPTFEKMYSEAKAELPAITQFLIAVGRLLTDYLPIVVGGIAAVVTLFVLTWRNPNGRFRVERVLLKTPLLESWLRSIAILQFIEVLGNLMDSGFTLAEALPHTSKGITNSVVRRSVEDLHKAIVRGERFSRELLKRSHIFPPVVTQLVIIGEQTGTLPTATQQIRVHIRREVERYTNLLTGAIEPVMTIGLASAIGGILMAVYLPMFDMIGAMNH
jgi:type II secretory pathway component PulF